MARGKCGNIENSSFVGCKGDELASSYGSEAVTTSLLWVAQDAVIVVEM